MVKIVDGPDASVYRESEFEVLSEPYEVGGEVVVKMKCNKTGKYFGGGYTTKYLKKVKNKDKSSERTVEDAGPYDIEEPAGDSSSMTQNDMAVPDAEV